MKNISESVIRSEWWIRLPLAQRSLCMYRLSVMPGLL